MKRRTEQEIILLFRELGFELVSPFEIVKKEVSVRCRCGSVFNVKPIEIIRGRKKSCGCLNQLPRENLIGKFFGKIEVVERVSTFNKYGKQIYQWKCKCLCGKTILASGARLKNGIGGCKKCVSKIGIQNPLFRGNNKNTERNKLKFVRPHIFERDNYTCQICRIRGGKLNAHHLNNWADFPEERFDDLNLITLCKKCHICFHRINGKKNNTKSQFIDFINTYVV